MYIIVTTINVISMRCQFWYDQQCNKRIHTERDQHNHLTASGTIGLANIQCLHSLQFYSIAVQLACAISFNQCISSWGRPVLNIKNKVECQDLWNFAHRTFITMYSAWPEKLLMLPRSMEILLIATGLIGSKADDIVGAKKTFICKRRQPLYLNLFFYESFIKFW